MSSISIKPSYPIFTDIDGQPLEYGYVWIGAANLDPQTNPIQVYLDAALTIPAAQPIRTLDGYLSMNGSPANIYVAQEYSIRVMNKNGTTVYSSLNGNADRLGFLSVKEFGAVGDGITNDTSAIQNAVTACLNSGQQLYFPEGTYLTYSSISNFHNVVKFGPGKIKRGSGFFYIQIQASQSNTLYLSASGSDSNDGLSSAEPIATVQKAFDTLKTYGPTLNGTWTLQLAAGTYNAAAQLVGLRSLNNIIIRGPSVGGHPNVPTAVIDGSGITSSSAGWYFQFYVKASVYNVKFQNWDGSGVEYGVVADGHCQLYLDNCHFYRCYYAGVSCDNLTQLRMLGGIVDDCTFFGVRLYSQSSASVGYTGTSIGSSTEIKNCGTGIIGRVNCRVHVDYCNIHDCSNGIVSEYNTRTVVNYTKTENCTIGWYSTRLSNIQTSVNGSNSVAGTVNPYICFSSLLSATTADESNYNAYWDEGTKRSLYGASSYRTPSAKFEWQCDSARSNASYNSNVKAIFDFNGSTNYLGLSGPSTSTVGLLFSTVSKPAQGVLTYDFSSDFWAIWVSGAPCYRVYQTRLIPLVDNSSSLGDMGFRWSVVYAATGAINTSDAREKQQIRSLNEKERAVATRLKSLIRAFKFNDAVQSKGDNARIHVGVIAQDVKTAFEAEGLIAENYAILCYDEWSEQLEKKDENDNVVEQYRPAGNMYGVRYDELLAFIIGAI